MTTPDGNPPARTRDTPNWDGALCREVGDPDLWFPEKGGPANSARAVCNVCPLREKCLDWAIANNEVGIWGGTSERQRRKLAKARAAAGVPRKPKARHVQPCGTDAAYARHRRNNEPACGACTEAHRIARIVREEERPA